LTDRAVVRIVLADGQALFREGVRMALQSEEDLRVVATASDGLGSVAAAERERPDVALLDADLLECDGVQATKMIKQRVPECRVIVLARDAGSAALLSAVEAGANGYLTRDSSLSELIEATRAVNRGETVIPPRMLGGLLSLLINGRREQDAALRRMACLTRREKEVLALLADGADNDVIADALVISPQTARTHVQNVLAKLKVHSRLEAAAFVIQNAILADLVAADL
jgi:DNA-binding NarL/FixJ family response regulator